jgi:hypothetical protein
MCVGWIEDIIVSPGIHPMIDSKDETSLCTLWSVMERELAVLGEYQVSNRRGVT